MKTYMELLIMMSMELHVKEGRIELIFNCLFQVLKNMDYFILSDTVHCYLYWAVYCGGNNALFLRFIERKNFLPVFFHIHNRPTFLLGFIQCFIELTNG